MKLISGSRKMVKILTLFGSSGLLLLLLVPLVTTAAFTKQINYQGKLTNAAGSAVADGNYSIEFKLYAASSGGSALWIETQTVAVTNGLFSIMLGSVTSLDSFDFNRPLYLTLNVQGDGEMTPRKVLGSVPNSFNAEKFDGLATTSFAVLNQNNIFSGLNTFSATTTLATTTFFTSNPLTISQGTVAGYPVNLFSSDNGSAFKNGLSIYRDDSESPFLTMSQENAEDQIFSMHFDPSVAEIEFNVTDLVSAVTPTTTFKFWGDIDVVPFINYISGADLSFTHPEPTAHAEIYVSGKYAYLVTSSYAEGLLTDASSTLSIVDVSDPLYPKKISSINVLPDARSVMVVGKYAYIGGYNLSGSVYDGLDIVDISNPYSPQIIGGNNLALPGHCQGVQVVGKLAYMSCFQNNDGGTDGFRIIDVSEPENPRVIGGQNLALPKTGRTVAVSGRYAYIPFYQDTAGTNGFRILDISNPVNPVVVGGESLTLPAKCRTVAVSGRYAYLGCEGVDDTNLFDGGLSIIDVSNPSDPVVVKFSTEVAPGPEYSLFGKYLFSGLLMTNISSSTNPFRAGTFSPGVISQGSVWGHFVSGKYLYTALSGNDEFNITDALRISELTGADLQALSVGSLDVGRAQIHNDLIVSGQILANDGLNVGLGGIMSYGSLSINSTNTPSFFGGSVGIGTTSPISKLSVVGTTTLSVGDTYWQTSKLFVNGVGDIPLLLAHGASTTDPTTTYDFGAIKNNLYLVNNNGADNAALSFLQVDSTGGPVSAGSLTFDFGSSYFTVNTDFNPVENNAYDLGSPSLSWRNIYASTSISLGSLNSNGPVYSNNGALTNVNPSSRGYKDNILDASLNIDGLLGLQVKSFDWKTNGQSDFGLIAEEVRDVLPELYVDDGVTRGYRSGQLPFYLLQIAQRQEKKLAELDMRIASGTIAVATSSTEALNLQAIQSITGNWSISEDGTLVAKNIKAENATIENGVTIRDRATGNYSCIYIENGLIKTSAGECPTGNLVNPPTIPSGGTTASPGEVVDDPVASSTDSGEVSTTTPSSTETTPGEAESTPPTIVESTPPVIVPEEVTLPVE